MEGGSVIDFTLAREAKNDLRCAVNDSLADVKSWGGEFPFERAAASIEYWKFWLLESSYAIYICYLSLQ